MKYTRLSLLILALDLVFNLLVFYLFYFLRFQSGWFGNVPPLPAGDLVLPAVLVSVFWVVIFWLHGNYKFALAPSRLDELIRVIRGALTGILVLALFLMPKDLFRITHLQVSVNREGFAELLRFIQFISLYLVIFVLLVGGVRIMVLSLRRRMFRAGRGLKSVLIVGFNEQGWNILRQIRRYPALGYRVLGFVATQKENAGKSYQGVSVIAPLEDLRRLVEELQVQEVVVAIAANEHQLLLEVIAQLEDLPTGIKIIPDLYNIISGQARVSQIYGFPLISINPRILGRGELFLKRLLDLSMAVILGLAVLPLLPFIALAIKLDSPGPVIYSQERVGREGRIFHIYKFRTMYRDAEKTTGPVWSRKNDPRITRVGRFLRKTRLDELPQLWNILRNDMSFVGPRPERPFFVERFMEKFPLYRYRLKLKPGITGWAQVKHKYDETEEDVERKLRFDLFYLENLSVSLDLKIIFSTIATVISRKGQ